ncbi:MAG: PilC/PilY family type IV pilus protein [Desulfobacterales bacterium]|jgi:type IV pilus assembly protein PilY1|nr:PilC/PilY family type IV pilus protein [Desulfobacterales bacterium]
MFKTEMPPGMDSHRRGAALFAVVALLFWGLVPIHFGASADIQLSDTPMFTRVLPPPANIMFVLDDSGSMNFEVMVSGGFDGSFNPTNPALRGYCYLFDNLGDNKYSQAALPSWYAGSEGRKYWKTQYFGVNAMYYNPQVAYLPWPSYGSVAYPNAHANTPRSHPNFASPALNLSSTSYTIGAVNVPHARYALFDPAENKKYLVVLDSATSTKKYYEISTVLDGLEEKISGLAPVGALPAGLDSGRSYDEERQNFANWFTYHRRREYVAKNALAKILKDLAEVRVGIYGINQTIVQPLADIKVKQGAAISDNTNLLIEKIYAYQSYGGTPLKGGLKTVGNYFKDNTGVLAGVSGPKPYGTLAEGGSCQQSFAVLFTDGFYNDLTTTLAGNSDGDKGHPYADAYSNTLADFAMYFYATDLNASLPDEVPKSRYDKAQHQHLAVYSVAFGVSGTLNPNHYDAELKHKTTGLPIVWPKVDDAYAATTVDDLWHAAVNGRGRFYSAQNPIELTNALNELMEAIGEILIASSSSVTVNGDYLYAKAGPDTLLYQALYSNQNDEWAGDIKAFPVDPVTGQLKKSDPKGWSAAEKLESKGWEARLIATFNGAAGIPFREENLSAAQKTALGAEPADKVMYLRGGEVSGYRYRSQKLGDIVSSAPVFMDDVVYSGGNDGMLHAFDARSGEELFAYVPNLVFENLKLLTETNYSHRFYVDLTPTVKRGDILGGTLENPKTLLVGGLRKGGKGYFALDITAAKAQIDSESVLASRVLWEFPQTADPDMGYSFSKPVIVKTLRGGSEPWAVIFGNGYNSESGVSALYVVDPRDGSLIRKIVAGAGPDNGMSHPIAVDVSSDGRVDFVYAGDLKGNLWKFDLTGSDPGAWDVAFFKNGERQPLFQARGPGGALQPITTKPDVMFHPKKHGYMVCFGTGKYLGEWDQADNSTQTIYGIWDYGDRFYDLRKRSWSPDDNEEFLGAFDRGASPQLSNQPAAVTLLQQTLTDRTVAIGAEERMFRMLSNQKPSWITMPDANDPTAQKPDLSSTEANHGGFYLDLPPGERVISDVVIRDRLLLAIGFTPNSDRCGPGGDSMFMAINAFTGGYSGGGVFDITGDRKIDEKDLLSLSGLPSDWAPSGVGNSGNIHSPAILKLPGSDGMYLSSSSGEIALIHAKSPLLGVSYWMEMNF